VSKSFWPRKFAELVEYFRSTEGEWFHVDIYVSLEDECFQYHVYFDKSAEPKLVSLELLRQPLEEGEVSSRDGFLMIL